MTLRVSDLTVTRGDRTLVAGLGFTVDAGEVLHLQGRNGAGKTSLLEVLCGLRPATAGSIEGRPEPAAFHWIGHKNSLNPILSVEENLRFWCDLHGLAAGGIDAALNRVGLKSLRHRPSRNLSTGQKRRAALTRLLAAPRAWWFLDEPLAGLDAAGLSLFGELLETHLREGGAAVLTSHQPLPIDAVRLHTLLLAIPAKKTAAAEGAA
jgi:heme exporter protein A